MSKILFFLMALVCTVCHAEIFKVDSITFDQTLFLDCESCSHPTAHYSIPQVKTEDHEQTSVADSINSQILRAVSYDEDYNVFTEYCHGVSFNYEMEDEYLLLDIEYVGFEAHGDVDNEETLIFDLETGDKVCYNEEACFKIPFASLFTLEGYFKFLNSHNWDEGVYKAFFDAYKDYYEYDENGNSSDEPADSSMVDSKAFGHAKYAQFHIDYRIDKEKIEFWRESNWYADFCYASRCFEPYYSKSCLIKDLKPYLNNIGKVVVDDKKSRIQKIVEAVNLKETVSDRLFFEVSEWRSPGKYVPHKVAIDCSDPEKIVGYLFIGDKKEKITGCNQDGTIFLKSRKSGWSFKFTNKDIEECFWNKQKRESGIIVGRNTSDDVY